MYVRLYDQYTHRTSIFSAFLMNGVMMDGLIAWMQRMKMGLELMMP